MGTYDVTLSARFSRTLTIDAHSWVDAERKANKMFSDGKLRGKSGWQLYDDGNGPICREGLDVTEPRVDSVEYKQEPPKPLAQGQGRCW